MGKAIIMRDGLKDTTNLEDSVREISAKVGKIEESSGSDESNPDGLEASVDSSSGEDCIVITQPEVEKEGLEFAFETIDDEEHLVINYYDDGTGKAQTGSLSGIDFTVENDTVSCTYA